MNRKCLIFACVLGIGMFVWHYRVYAETIVSADIAVDTMWTKEGSPYLVTVPLTIEAGAVLSVDPGVTVRLSGPDARVRVFGRLSAQGSVGGEIHIESDQVIRPGMTTFGGSIYMRNLRVSGLSSIDAFEGGSIWFDRATVDGARVGIYDSSLSAVDSSFLNAPQSAIMVFVETGTSSSALIRNSAISGAKSYGLYVGDGATVDARHNFWGDPSGPKSAQYNPLGKGVKVYGTFDLRPWLSRDPFACCSSVLFLPGLQASRLYVDETVPELAGSVLFGENMLWEPNRDGDVEGLGLTSTGASVRPVYTKVGDVMDEAYLSLAGPNIYKSFIHDMGELVATGTIGDWLPTAYDWRLSLDHVLERGSVSPSGALSYLQSTSTPYVIQEFYRLAEGSKTGRVSIVAHSHGGLLAKALTLYVEGGGDADLIDKIVFVAVPQTGTPQAVGSLLHGFNEGVPLLASAKAMRRLGQNMPSAYNLLPSARYLAFDSRPIISFSATTSSSSLAVLRSAYGQGIESSDALYRFLTGSEGRKSPAYSDLSLPETLNPRLLDKSSVAHASLDSWVPSPSSELFQIAGRGLDTVSGIEYYEGTKGKKPALFYRPVLVPDGDGTVVTQSAWAIPTSLNVSQYWVNLSQANAGIALDHSHANILEVPDLRDFIREILSELPHPIRHRGRVSSSIVAVPVRTQKSVRVFVHSSAAVVRAVDSAGHRTGASSSGGLVERQIPGSQYGEFGDVTYLSVPDSRVTISGVPDDSPSVTVDIDIVSGDAVVASHSYGDIALVATTSVITIDVTASSSDSSGAYVPPMLRVDDDGDGTVDREVLPDVPIRLPTDSDGVTVTATSTPLASSTDPVITPTVGVPHQAGGTHRVGGHRHSPDASLPVSSSAITAGPVTVVSKDIIAPSGTSVLVGTTSVTQAHQTESDADRRIETRVGPGVDSLASFYVAGSRLVETLGSRDIGWRPLSWLFFFLILALFLLALLRLSCKKSKSR